ncbi:hypothetical protein FHU36_007466 [Nonomuraea muscovyensis]|uniref:Uncharacterized protein n=1 Tax=Nonomuraea muscovyensis TaxID=1124761 RepID=A0A7X0CCR3_9ACTN|nr:hypothetical protein [Nonomuraea muscovyensis]
MFQCRQHHLLKGDAAGLRSGVGHSVTEVRAIPSGRSLLTETV